MEFLRYEFEAGPDDVIEVSLSGQANVRLLDSPNFQSYRAGRGHRCIGGLAKVSPVRLHPPPRALVCGDRPRRLPRKCPGVGALGFCCVMEAAMTKKTGVHVVPRSGGGWAVERGGAERASKVTRTQEQAIKAGKKIAERGRDELLIHGEDGRIREKNSYGNDPYPPKG